MPSYFVSACQGKILVDFYFSVGHLHNLIQLSQNLDCFGTQFIEQATFEIHLNIIIGYMTTY